jgi:glyoxalase family protein
MTAVQGIHHVTAIAGDPQRNLDFYAGLLGLRFVKRTVNFDDPQTYHFYFGDAMGTPGSIMTFFPWPNAHRGRQGAGQVAVTSFAALPGAIGFWIERLLRHGVKFQGPQKRPGAADEQVISFRDHDGLLLEIVAHRGAEARPAWSGARGITSDHALRGFHSVTLWEEEGRPTERLLVDVLGFRPLHEHENVRRFAAGDGGVGTLVEVRSTGGFVEGQPGAGTVHHVAWRVPDDAAQVALRSSIEKAGYQPTPVIDRDYFHSVYFREPGGVLFEIATDVPGFTIDEPVEHLGESLKLPRQYEPQRSIIESALPPIQTPSADVPNLPAFSGPAVVSGDALGFVHRFIPGSGPDSAGSTTLLLLHGTGGDEDNLISLGRVVLPGAALLSPRGKVNEGGALRFFRRIREGVFDQEDLARRTEELARFIEEAARTYALRPERIVAVGFSNGANIAGSLLFRRPGLLRAAALLSPMVPFEPDPLPRLEGTSVFVGAGRSDAMVPTVQTERLIELLEAAGADVAVHWDDGGHAMTPAELTAVRKWLARITAD